MLEFEEVVGEEGSIRGSGFVCVSVVSGRAIDSDIPGIRAGNRDHERTNVNWKFDSRSTWRLLRG